MKKIITFLLSFLWLSSFAQLDTDHWFAPMSARAGASNLESYLYLSTNETTPFNVQIFNNNTLFTTVQISKGSPTFVNIPGSFMLAEYQNELFTPSTKGMYVKGPKKFFANYRFTITNHGEIITSKGLAGLGTTFYAAMAANTTAKNYVSSNIGIIATEDNTTVTISGYDAGVVFSDGISTPTRTFTINKGQSYILDVASQDAQANLAGLIGAKILSNKPISVTNGNYNAIYTTLNSTYNDILMDQSVPIDRLGKDFVVVKGNGPISSQMEMVLVVATENNTQLAVNGNTYGSVLNEGDYTLIPSTQYIDQGNNHYNMGISSTKNIYVYELLAGTSTGNVYPTGGFNYIPPLSCFLPNKVDEVGFIDQIGSNFYNTKLNIITQTGASVTLNGTSIAAANGPYPVNGNPNWVSYSVPNITGTVTVNSTKSVTAGIAAGSGAIGYGGYFAGFSSVPVIVKTGDCYAGQIIQVDNTYDAYQWFLNGVAIVGATTYFINPELYGTGTYTCLITKLNCESKLTDPYLYTICPPITTATYTIGSCNTLTINPSFTTSTQTINPANTSIIVVPTNGTASVNSVTGQITYTPNTGLTADTTDFFVYYIQGNGSPASFEYFKVNVNIDVLKVNTATINSCTDINGNGTYNLTSVSVSPDAGTTTNYFLDATLTSPIATPTAYNGPAGTIYANVTSSFGCTKSTTITLTVTQSPNVNTTNYNASLCDTNFDGIVPVVFSTITPQIVNNASIFNVRYYPTQADALAGNANNLPNNWSFSGNTTVYVRVDSTIGNCPSAFGEIHFSIANQFILTNSNVTSEVCDNNLDGSEIVNLSNYLSLFTPNTSLTTSFYNSLSNAQNSLNPITASQTIAGTTIFYIRFESANTCPTIGKLTLTVKAPKKSLILVDQTICPEKTTILDAGTGFTSYLWNNGATTQSITAGVGTYYVDLGFNGCVYRQNVTVHAKDLPEIVSINVNGNTAVINVTGGTNPYQYSLNDAVYQISNTFSGLPRGTYTAYVTSADGCAPVKKEFLILDLINVITPNGDGVNDVLDYSDLRTKTNVSFTITDRYGALIYKNEPNLYLWDGKLNGRPLNSGTYWYVIKWIEPDTKIPVSYSGWVLLKNRQ